MGGLSFGRLPPPLTVTTTSKTRRWTNPSVLLLAGTEDPIQAITRKARDLVVAALDGGWAGPPFDPIALAEFNHIAVVPREDVGDARTVPTEHQPRIEYNPNRPVGRLRFSIAHEI